MMRRSACALVLMGVATLGGCGAGEGPVDCVWRVSYEGVTYRSDNQLVDPPPESKPVGTGDALDCEREPDHPVEVRAVDGVDPGVAIVVAITPDDSASLHVREGLDPAEWPDAILRGN